MASAPTSASAYLPPPPLTGSARLWGTLALSAATFMNVLDTSIANVSLPAIAGDLGVSPNQGTWVITSFGVANAIAVPLTGWLSQRFGQVRLFTASIMLFVLTSWLCGLAPNMTTLIFFRVLQGLVAGPMIPLSQALLLSSYPKALAGLAMALWSMTTLVAPVMGPLLGGWITDNISWPWIFYINIPVGFGAAFITWSIFHKRESQTRKLPIDSIGLALLVIWVGALQIMLDKGKELDWFHSGEVIALGIVALVGLDCLRDLGADRRASGGGSEPVQEAQLLGRRARPVSRLRPVFRQRGAAAAVAAAVHGLHRDPGRHGAGAGRAHGLAAVAAGRQEHRQGRPAPLCRCCLRRVCAGAVDALELQHPGRHGAPS